MRAFRPEPACLALDEIFENHLAFMASHRGFVVFTPDWIRVEGQADFLSSWTPLRPDAQLEDGEHTVRMVPGAGEQWPTELSRRGYAPAETLHYMELEPSAGMPPDGAPCLIDTVKSDVEADAFAQVQTAAFLNDGSAHRDWWVECFHRAARANYSRRDQEFLIAWLENRAAAVLLAVDTREVTGLYAVATRPEYQRRGLSTALLVQARRNAVLRGRDRLVLQAMTGSYAEGFYRRLGFRERYLSQVWRKPAS